MIDQNILSKLNLTPLSTLTDAFGDIPEIKNMFYTQFLQKSGATMLENTVEGLLSQTTLSGLLTYIISAGHDNATLIAARAEARAALARLSEEKGGDI